MNNRKPKTQTWQPDSISRFIDSPKREQVEILIKTPYKETEEGRLTLNEALNRAIISGPSDYNNSTNNFDTAGLITMLLLHVANPYYVPHTGLSPQVSAAEKGNKNAVRQLLKNNADINIQSLKGHTALVQAA